MDSLNTVFVLYVSISKNGIIGYIGNETNISNGKFTYVKLENADSFSDQLIRFYTRRMAEQYRQELISALAIRHPGVDVLIEVQKTKS